tara:strand:+ start:9465 stop:9863 length:399 start_codon:yes stop_codon:yes gene_type:complete
MKRVINCCYDFYHSIGKLFYAVAAIDGTIRQEEYKLFIEKLRSEFISKKGLKKEAIKEIIHHFQCIYLEKPSPEESFRDFLNYKKTHSLLFTDPMTLAIWEVACTISEAVNHKNKSELILLARLGKGLGIMK